MDRERYRSPMRKLREASGLSIRQLEELSGINRGRLSVIERGVPPTDDEAERILDALAASNDRRHAETER